VVIRPPSVRFEPISRSAPAVGLVRDGPRRADRDRIRPVQRSRRPRCSLRGSLDAGGLPQRAAPQTRTRSEREDTMALVRRIARPLLAAPFVVAGVRTALRPEREIDVCPQAFEAADSTLAKSSAPGFLDARTIIRASGVAAA